MKIALIFCLVLGGCLPGSGADSVPAATPETAPLARPTEAQASPAPTPLPVLKPATPAAPRSDAAYTPAEVSYSLIINFDYAHHHLVVNETVGYTNRSVWELPELLFIIEPARKEGVFRLTGCKLADELQGSCKLEAAILRVALPSPLKNGDQARVVLSYELTLPAQPNTLGFTQRQTNLIDWYPFIPPYLPASGWLVREPGKVGEHLVYEMADYEVELQIANRPATLILAASAAPKIEGSVYRFEMKRGRSFAWSASPEYQTLQETSGSVKITSYYFPKHQAAAEAGLKAAKESLQLYSDLFSPYPHPSLSIVEAEFFDGMEDDGIFFLGTEYYTSYTNSPRSYMTALSAHETAHLWWYGLVANDHAKEPWLDEALATYSELFYYERKYPDLVSWWWDYRVNRFSPGGWVNTTVYDYQNFRSYVNAVYLQGALFLKDLRELVGNDIFFMALKEYTLDRSGKLATADSFLNAVKRLSKADLQPVTARYFKNN